MKDNFSHNSSNYAKFRPSYPLALLQHLASLTATKACAWDCGTGNGQVAVQLAKLFEKVYATDFSQAQLDCAPLEKNIIYSVQPAEQTNFPNAHFDLIVVAQAIHWFNFDSFYSEVKRTLKPNGIVAAIGYGVPTVSPEIDALVANFYTQIIGPYWDAERKYIDENYETIPFPFREIALPHFDNSNTWELDHFLGYIGSWSAVKHYETKNATSPMPFLASQLNAVWKNGATKNVTFSMLLRVGQIQTQ